MKPYLGKMLVGVSLFLLTPFLQADTWIRFQSHADSKLEIKGTSSAHDWSVQTNSIEGAIELEPEILTAQDIKPLKSLSQENMSPKLYVSIPILSLKSGKSGMDKNMYSALHANQHPNIEYRLNKAAIRNRDQALTEKIILLTSGDLKIAGAIKPIEMEIELDRTQPKRLIFTGKTSFNMTDFNIKPPKALLGMLKTGDRVEIYFAWITELES